MAEYKYDQAWITPFPGIGFFIFAVKAGGDVHILLNDKMDDTGNPYEILINGWTNTRLDEVFCGKGNGYYADGIWDSKGIIKVLPYWYKNVQGAFLSS